MNRRTFFQNSRKTGGKEATTRLQMWIMLKIKQKQPPLAPKKFLVAFYLGVKKDTLPISPHENENEIDRLFKD